MSVRSITVSASASGLSAAASWLEGYANRLEKNVNELISAMLKEGEQYAIDNLGHIDTGETVSSIMAYREGSSGLLVVGGNAIWIEFGTGVYAPGQTDHPKASELGMSPHGTYGLGHGADPNGWYYQGDDGQWHHTMGIPSNRFFYNTAQMLRREYKRIAQEVFG